MPVTLVSITLPPEPKPLVIGPRTRSQIELRIRELEGRLKRIASERGELARLKEIGFENS